jgi:hypothetical protein
LGCSLCPDPSQTTTALDMSTNFLSSLDVLRFMSIWTLLEVAKRPRSRSFWVGPGSGEGGSEDSGRGPEAYRDMSLQPPKRQPRNSCFSTSRLPLGRAVACGLETGPTEVKKGVGSYAVGPGYTRIPGKPGTQVHPGPGYTWILGVSLCASGGPASDPRGEGGGGGGRGRGGPPTDPPSPGTQT